MNLWQLGIQEDGEGKITFDTHTQVEVGKGELLRDGDDVTIIAIGKCNEKAVEVYELIKEKGIYADVINIRFLKPIDEELIIKSAGKTKNVITIEDGILTGGLYSKVVEVINKNNLNNIQVKGFGYSNEFIKHGSIEELEKEYKLNNENIAKTIIDMKK